MPVTVGLVALAGTKLTAGEVPPAEAAGGLVRGDAEAATLAGAVPEGISAGSPLLMR